MASSTDGDEEEHVLLSIFELEVQKTLNYVGMIKSHMIIKYVLYVVRLERCVLIHDFSFTTLP